MQRTTKTSIALNEQVTIIAFEHYLKHHEVVCIKLTYAKKATKMSIKDSKEATKLKSAANANNDKVLSYEQLWDSIIAMMKDAGLSENDLKKIESLLNDMPITIKRIYEILIKKDQKLQKLLRELQSDRYRDAFRMIENVQSKIDLLSGLEAKEFDFNDGKTAYIFKPQNFLSEMKNEQ